MWGVAFVSMRWRCRHDAKLHQSDRKSPGQEAAKQHHSWECLTANCYRRLKTYCRNQQHQHRASDARAATMLRAARFARSNAWRSWGLAIEMQDVAETGKGLAWYAVANSGAGLVCCCRGHYCVFAFEAFATFHARGHRPVDGRRAARVTRSGTAHQDQCSRVGSACQLKTGAC